MKVEELRIGNEIECYSNITCKWIKYKVHINSFNTFTYKFKENFRPIPLTEKWLIKLGWYQDVDKNGQLEYIKPVCNYSIKHTIQYFAEYQFRIIAQFKYVHQLQNLHFALTGEELKLQS